MGVAVATTMPNPRRVLPDLEAEMVEVGVEARSRDGRGDYGGAADQISARHAADMALA